jgi:putative redox protein
MTDNKSIRVSLPGGVLADADFKGFHVRTDQPVHDGGAGSAPSPFDFFLVSLATCAGYFVAAFCRERKIPTDGISVTMTWEGPPRSRLIKTIRIEIALPAGFPEKYRTAVVKAADQCTVKAHLADPPAIEVTASVGGL